VTPYQMFGPLHWREVPSKMRDDYTLGKRIPVSMVFMNDTAPLKAGAASGSATGRVAYNRLAINTYGPAGLQGSSRCPGLCSNAFRGRI